MTESNKKASTNGKREWKVEDGGPVSAKATARQVVKNIFVKVEVSAFSLGFQQNLAVVANDEFLIFPVKIPR